MNVPGFVFNPIALAIEGAAIGFLIAIPVGPAAVLCIRRSITVGAVAGYMTGIGAALGDAVFGAVAAFGLSFVEQFVIEREAWLLGIGGIGLVIMGWTTMRNRPRTVGDPVADDREHQVATHFHYASSSFFITVFNPLTVMAFGAAFAGRNLAGVGANLADAALLVAAVFCGALAWWTDHLHGLGVAAPPLHRRRPVVAEPRLGCGHPGLRAGGADLAAAAAVAAEFGLHARALGSRIL